MKYASYILATLGVILLLNIFLSYSSKSYRAFLRDTKSSIVGVSREDALESMNKDLIENNQKLYQMIDKLNENIDRLNKKQEQQTTAVAALTSTASTVTATGETSTGVIDEAPVKPLLEIPLSLLKKLLPSIDPKKIENAGIYGIKDEKFEEKLDYVTYYYFKKRLTIYVFDKDYKSIMSDLKKTNAFKLNESDTFYGFTFYLNPIKKDNKVRFVTQIEGISVGFEIDKPFYDQLKKALLK